VTLQCPYGFSATTLPFFQKYMGVPCMRATLRAVLAARRIPRPTPAAKLSGLLGVLRLVVMVRVPSVLVSLRSCRSSPMIRQGPVDFKKVSPATLVAAKDIAASHIMPALFDPSSDAN
jgi:hypothetical protein